MKDFTGYANGHLLLPYGQAQDHCYKTMSYAHLLLYTAVLPGPPALPQELELLE